MYLITKEQFVDVVKQENDNSIISINFEEVKRKGSKIFRNSWYGNIIYLGNNEGYPIFTFTHYKNLGEQISNIPSDVYIQIIAAGLKEIRNWAKDEIVDYLIQKPGIKGSLNKEELKKLII